MKYLIIAAFFSASAFVGAQEAAAVKDTTFKHKLAKDFGVCPDGHKALADIPIVYGHVGPLWKKPKDYTAEDRELKEKRDRGEIAFGGDVLGEHPPKFRVACKECGYRFHASDMPAHYSELSFWSKDSKNPDDFKRKLSKRLFQFPRMEGAAVSISFSQTLSGDGETVNSEGVSYHTNLPIDKVLERVRGWLIEQRKDPKDLVRVTKAAAHHTYQYSKDGISLHVMDDEYWEPGKINVSLSFSCAKKDKPKLKYKD